MLNTINTMKSDKSIQGGEEMRRHTYWKHEQMSEESFVCLKTEFHEEAFHQ